MSNQNTVTSDTCDDNVNPGEDIVMNCNGCDIRLGNADTLSPLKSKVSHLEPSQQRMYPDSNHVFDGGSCYVANACVECTIDIVKPIQCILCDSEFQVRLKQCNIVPCKTYPLYHMPNGGSDISKISAEIYHMVSRNQETSIVNSQHGKITLASFHVVNVLGTCHITVRLVHGKYSLPVTVLEKCSFPMILGETYLSAKGIILDYASMQFQVTKCKVRARQKAVVPGNSKTVIWAKIPRAMPVGLQGICSNCSHNLQCNQPDFYKSTDNLLSCKSLVTVKAKHLVPIKLLNPTHMLVTRC